jgi:hypothetical protein
MAQLMQLVRERVVLTNMRRGTSVGGMVVWVLDGTSLMR